MPRNVISNWKMHSSDNCRRRQFAIFIFPHALINCKLQFLANQSRHNHTSLNSLETVTWKTRKLLMTDDCEKKTFMRNNWKLLTFFPYSIVKPREWEGESRQCQLIKKNYVCDLQEKCFSTTRITEKRQKFNKATDENGE